MGHCVVGGFSLSLLLVLVLFWGVRVVSGRSGCKCGCNSACVSPSATDEMKKPFDG